MKDRNPKYPGRVRLVPVDEQDGVYDMIRADEPEEAGTPINKQSLLTDETAEALGLDLEDDPTPDDALYSLAGKIGDVRETLRTDLGEKWILCNGEIVPEGMYPELRELLPYNTSWRKLLPTVSIGNASTYDYADIRPLPIAGKWAFTHAYASGTSIPSSGRAAVYDIETDTLTPITCPTVSGATKSYSIFGLTHNGDNYVLGVYEAPDGTTAGKVRLYTSSDLVTWKLGYTFSCESYTRLAMDLSFDGTNLLYYEYNNASSEYTNYDAIYSINKAMTNKTKLIGPPQNYSNRFVVLPSGYWTYQDPNNSSTISAYAPGGKTPLFYFSYSCARIAFFSDRYWVGLPYAANYVQYMQAVDLTTNTVDKIRLDTIIGDNSAETSYMQGAKYDKNKREWVFYLKISVLVGADWYCAAYISEDANPLDKTQYRIEKIAELPEMLSYEQMAPDRTQLRVVSSTERYLHCPYLKYLPMHDGDTYKYIHKGG